MKIQHPQRQKNFAVNVVGQRINPKPLKSTFAPMENWLLENADISFGAKVLYGRLVQFANKDGVAWPTREQLAKALRISTDQIDRYIKELVNCGLICVEKRGFQLPNQYYFLYHPWMDGLLSPDLGIPEAADMQTLEAAHVQTLEAAHVQTLEAAHVQTPLNKRTKEKNNRKEHTEEKEVCVPSTVPVSEYSSEEWKQYTEKQPNIKVPIAVANNLAKSKKNDWIMKEFLQKLEQEKPAKPSYDGKKERDLLIARILATPGPLGAYELGLLKQLGYNCQSSTSVPIESNSGKQLQITQ